MIPGDQGPSQFSSAMRTNVETHSWAKCRERDVEALSPQWMSSRPSPEAQETAEVAVGRG